MMQPKVSVVVATYHREAELSRALESLAAQTYKNTEIILVDDNGTAEWSKKIEEMVAAYCADHPNMDIRLIVNLPNQGSARARNIGIQEASGMYITFLDDDDIYLPNKIENQVNAMATHAADYCITDLKLYSENDKLLDKRTRRYITHTDVKSLILYHLKYHMTGTDTMMFKKEYLQKIGGFDDIDVGDEFYLMQKAILGNGKFHYEPICDVKAYVHTGADGGLSSGQQKIDGENQLYQYKKGFFSQIDWKSRRYIRMRHHAVLAFAGLRMKAPLYTIKNGLMSFAISPLGCIKLLLERKT